MRTKPHTFTDLQINFVQAADGEELDHDHNRRLTARSDSFLCPFRQPCVNKIVVGVHVHQARCRDSYSIVALLWQSYTFSTTEMKDCEIGDKS